MLKILDVHTHILPAVDDGAKDINESLKLLKMLKNQGVTDVVLTPHFTPSIESFEERSEKWLSAYKELLKQTDKKSLPYMHKGCEVFYFEGMGKIKAVRELCIESSNYLLLELALMNVSDKVISDIRNLNEQLGIIPIIAHIERYYNQKGFRKLKALVKEGVCIAQLNASSLFLPIFKKAALKLLKEDLIYVIASDTHSQNTRPPEIAKAFKFIEEKYGSERVEKYKRNSEIICNEISGKENEK